MELFHRSKAWITTEFLKPLLRFFEKIQPCLVGLEACGGSHYWAREIAEFGHDARLIPPIYVKPFVKRGKTDAADAGAISEAATRKTMRFVPVKTADQQTAAMVLKTRALLVRQQRKRSMRFVLICRSSALLQPAGWRRLLR